jgi:hypothetical protein
MKNRTLLMAMLVIIMAACQAPADEAQMAIKMPPGLDLMNMDTASNPKEDFYQFANG